MSERAEDYLIWQGIILLEFSFIGRPKSALDQVWDRYRSWTDEEILDDSKLFARAPGQISSMMVVLVLKDYTPDVRPVMPLKLQ